MQSFHEALMDLDVVDGEVVDQQGNLFDRVAYSRFKYGFTPPGVEYGELLAAAFGDEQFSMAKRNRISVVSAPYKFLPTASHVVAQAFTARLSHSAVLQRLEPPVLVPFFKSQVGDNKYAQSSEQERLDALATLGLQIDEKRVSGTHMVVIDDIRITGGAEKTTAKYLETLDLASVSYLHVARLNETVGKAHPGLEDELNQTVEHSLGVILQQERNGQFQLNTRVLRFILEQDTEFMLVSFAMSAPLHLLEEIHQAGVGNGPAYYERYRDALECIYGCLRFRSGKVTPLYAN